jgi:hypothetical protein
MQPSTTKSLSSVATVVSDMDSQELRQQVTSRAAPIYARLVEWGYQHKSMCHAKGEYARSRKWRGKTP